jgi:hypothetical protein
VELEVIAPPATSIPRVLRVDVADFELAYLVLLLDAVIYVSKGDPADPERAAWYLSELTNVTKQFVDAHETGALEEMLDRLSRLAGIRR